ncbi:unnamed protein product, partial [Symbiodinium microadriaticum]
NFKRRFFVIKGCVMMYYQTDLAFTQNFAELPKGVHVITGLRDSSDKIEKAWIIDTLDGKPFLVTAPSEADKVTAVAAMKLAIRAYNNQFMRAETQNVETALGLSLCNAGYLSMAIEKLEGVVRVNPNDADGFYHLGTMYMMLGSDEGLQGSLENLQRCIELDNNHIDALANLGLTLLMLEDLEGAYKALSAVLAHTPTHVEAANNLAILLVNRRSAGDLEQAEARLQYSIQCDQTNPNLYMTYCDLLLAMGNRQGAMEAIQRGIDAGVGKCSILNLRAGELLLEEGELDGAIESLKEAVDIDPTNKDALGLLNWTLRSREEYLGGGQEAAPGGEGVGAEYRSDSGKLVEDEKRGQREDTVGATESISTEERSENRTGGSDGGSGINAYNILKSLRPGMSSLSPAVADKKKKRSSVFF